MESDVEFDAGLPPLGRDFVARAKSLARAVVAPAAAAWERERAWPMAAFREACAHGLAGMEISPAQGGHGQPFGVRMRVAEELARQDFAFSFALINHHNAAARIADAGSPVAIERHLPAMLAGDRIGCTAMSEPGAGSDFSAIATTARKDTDGWRLDGEKKWIGNAAVAGVFLTFAQTDPGSRTKGIACFIVDDGCAGFHRGTPASVPGIQAAGLGGFTLTACRVPDAMMLFAPGGAGFRHAMAGVNKARTHVAAMAAGIVAASLDVARAHAGRRHAFARPLMEHQGLRWTLADAATTLEALRLLTYRAAQLISAGHDAQRAAAMAKKFAGDHAAAAVSACMQVLGAEGLTEEAGFTRRLAAARALASADGTTEMMNERIAALLG